MRQWVQITSARGPVECAWAVPRVLRAFCDEASRAGVSVEVLEAVPGWGRDTLASALLAVDGAAVPAFLRSWKGTVLWIGRSTFRPHERRRNWFVGVDAFGIPERVAWSERDLRIDVMRASGPGGQHVNKTESAVRITHLPTGIAVMAREERSQIANRKLALARLAQALNDRQQQSLRNATQQRWSKHNQLERGNPIRVYRGEEFELDAGGYLNA